MASRGRYNQSNEWDSREDSYNRNSENDTAYMDDDSSSDVNLDHCRLYIKNIPKGLNAEGLRAAFAKFGTLVEVYSSKDPAKSFGLVKYETPGEAKLAMMKMNRTEPLKLQVNIAYKSKGDGKQQNNRDWQDQSTGGGRDRNGRSSGRDRDDCASVVSRSRGSRVQDETPNSDNNMDDMLMEDDYGFSDILDPNLHLELEHLKLEQLKVREEQLQCKQKLILLKQAERKPMSQMGTRCILPDGKIVVRNAVERQPPEKTVRFREPRDADVSFTAGAGDSLKLPGLQRVAAQQCVVCGRGADAYCAGCGITPYCSERCQRRDWQDRHSAVCHNLARMKNESARASGEIAVIEPTPTHSRIPVQPAVPLRRPHATTPNNKRDGADARISTESFSSKASVKSNESNGKEDRYNNNQKERYPPKTEVQDTRSAPSRNMFNRGQAPATKPAEEPKNAQPARSAVSGVAAAVAAAKKHNLVPKKALPDPPTAQPEVVTPKEESPPLKDITSSVQPASVSDLTPTRRQVMPKTYLMEKMSVGDSIVMSLEGKAADCRITRGDFICLTMAESSSADYQSLCEDFAMDCNQDEVAVKLVPGETISYFNPEDEGWYRARVLNPTSLALLDMGKVVTVTAADKCRKLPSKYEAIPEFCAVLSSKSVQLGANLSCTILSKTSNGYKISMTDAETNASLGEGEVFRWMPTVEYQAATAKIPEVSRPPLTDGSKVLLVSAQTLDRVFVRPADGDSQRSYNDVLQQVLLSAMKEKALTSPPLPGQTVIGKFSDGNHYRALVRRVNVKQNKYQIEYAEYGNIEISTLENLYPCPPELDLSAVMTQVSVLKLAQPTELSAAAKDFIDELLQDTELVLVLPGGRKSAPSGSDALLAIASNKLDLGARLVEMSTPNWKKIEQRGGDVVDTEHIMYRDIKFASLPAAGCTVEVVDISTLKGGTVCGYDSKDPLANLVFGELTKKMADYCNSELGREPYLPKAEELCIAQLPPYPQWFRAVFVDLVAGPGSDHAKLCYLDYGNIETIPVTLIRKMMPEFIEGYPVLGLSIEIRDFPKDPTNEQVVKALTHLQVDEEGKGLMQVYNCAMLKTEGVEGEGSYVVDAPELLKAMKG